MVAAAAAVIFSGCGYGASSVQTTPATMTATGPDGQAVTNQKAAVIATANADRIPVRTAVRGSDQRGAAGMGFDNVPPFGEGRHTLIKPISGAGQGPRSRGAPKREILFADPRAGRDWQS